MLSLSISCLTTSNLPWFMGLTFQVPVQYCSLQHQTLFSPPDTSTDERCFHLGPAVSFFNCRLLFPSSILDIFQPGGVIYRSILDIFPPGGLIFWCRIFLKAFSCSLWSSPGKITGVGCHFLLQWTMFCQNPSLWPVCLGWPGMVLVIDSLCYASPFTTTRLWSMKGNVLRYL